MRIRRPTGSYRRRALAGTLICLTSLAALTVAVATGSTVSWDISAREHFRPDFVWGDNQQRANHVVFWLGPEVILAVFVVGCAIVSLWRLTLWPLVQAGVVVATTAGAVVALKFLVDRGDPTGQHTSLGGSFPSGHSAVLLVCVATGAMLVSCPTRWWQRGGCVLLEGILAVAMLAVGLHWLTDIVGGALVAGLVLGVEAVVVGPGGGWSHRGRHHRLRRRVGPHDEGAD